MRRGEPDYILFFTVLTLVALGIIVFAIVLCGVCTLDDSLMEAGFSCLGSANCWVVSTTLDALECNPATSVVSEDSPLPICL